MSSGKKYSLILMDDGGQTRSIRISKGFCAVVLCLVIVMPLLGSAGIWVGWRAWHEQQEWLLERRSLHAELDSLEVEVERYANMETLYRQSGAQAAPGDKDVADSAKSAPAAPAAPAAGAVAENEATESAAAPSASASGASGTNGTSPEQAGSEVASGIEGGAHKTDVDISLDTGQARVENVQARLLDPRRLRVNVDLYNIKGGGTPLAGRVVFSLVTAEGQSSALPAEDTSFRISRFKKIVSTVPLPTALTDVENSALLVEVLVDENIIFRKLYPVESR